MKDKEIKRLTHEGVNYIIGVQFINVLDVDIPYPYISVTTKSAKRNRKSKPVDRHELHFNLLPIKKPIVLFRKIYEALDSYLSDKEYVMFSANEDKQRKRELIYLKSLQKMGFKYSFSANEDVFFMSRNPVTNKLKKIVINSLN